MNGITNTFNLQVGHYYLSSLEDHSLKSNYADIASFNCILIFITAPRPRPGRRDFPFINNKLCKSGIFIHNCTSARSCACECCASTSLRIVTDSSYWYLSSWMENCRILMIFFFISLKSRGSPFHYWTLNSHTKYFGWCFLHACLPKCKHSHYLVCWRPKIFYSGC